MRPASYFALHPLACDTLCCCPHLIAEHAAMSRSSRKAISIMAHDHWLAELGIITLMWLSSFEMRLQRQEFDPFDICHVHICCLGLCI